MTKSTYFLEGIWKIKVHLRIYVGDQLVTILRSIDLPFLKELLKLKSSTRTLPFLHKITASNALLGKTITFTLTMGDNKVLL